MKFLQAAALLVALIFNPAHAQVGPRVGNIAWMSVGFTGGPGDAAFLQLIGSNGLYSNASHGCGTALPIYTWYISKSAANFDVFFAQLVDAAASGRQVHLYGTLLSGTYFCQITSVTAV
jgi:hypothetical protein